MTLTDLIPSLGGKPKARKANRVETKLRKTEAQLAAVREDNAKLLNFKAAADDYFALLIQDRNEVYQAWAWSEQRRQEAEVVAACAMSERDELAEEVDLLRKELAPFLAAEANATAVTVPPMVRDTTAIEDQATGPINVTALWEARDAGLLGPVLDPGHVHSQGVA